jgi:hypothetical protein
MVLLSPINPAIPRCPRCHAKDVIKKGTRKTRHEARQRWGCNRCGHTFTNLVTKHSPYPVKVIMEAMCRYNLGYSTRDTVRYLTRRFHLTVPEKTFRLWYTAHKPICTYHTIRAAIAHRVEPDVLLEKTMCSIARCTSIPCTTASSRISSRSPTTVPMHRSETILSQASPEFWRNNATCSIISPILQGSLLSEFQRGTSECP